MNRLLEEWRVRQERLIEWRNNLWKEEDEKAIDFYFNWHFDFLINFYERPPDTYKVLDVGCGYMLKNFDLKGRLDILLQAIGGQYTGIDPETEWFNISENLNLKQAMGENIPFPDNSFDYCLCLGTLDHVMDPLKVLSEINRVLKNGGLLWLANPYTKQRGSDFYHLHKWTKKGLQNLVWNSGFDILATRDCPITTSHYIKAEVPR